MNAPQIHPVIVTITGPSASGKTVLSDLLHEAGLRTLVSSTTRAPRRGEVEGEAYHFMSEDEFSRRMEAGRFIESIVYNGTMYGVSADEAEAAFAEGTSAVLVAEPHGSAQIVQYAEPRGWSVLRVFVDNPDEVLLGRLLNRLTQDVLGQVREDNDLAVYAPMVKRLSELLATTSIEQQATVLPGILVDFLTEQAPASEQKDQIITATDGRLVAAVKRLTAFGFEKLHWVEPARNGLEAYDVITDRFDASVQGSVVDQIMSLVTDLQVNPPTRHHQSTSSTSTVSRGSRPKL